MMSRAEHEGPRDRMHTMKTYDECEVYDYEPVKQMAERAKEKAKTLNIAGMKLCEMLRDKGRVK